MISTWACEECHFWNGRQRWRWTGKAVIALHVLVAEFVNSRAQGIFVLGQEMVI